jgi:hypothetical protein
MFKEAFQQGKFSPGIVITFQVMTLSRVSPGNPYPVSPVTKSIQDKLRAHPTRTRDADHPYIGRIRQPAHPCQISSTVTAPVAEKGDNSWFNFLHVLHFLHGHKVSFLSQQFLSVPSS